MLPSLQSSHGTSGEIPQSVYGLNTGQDKLKINNLNSKTSSNITQTNYAYGLNINDPSYNIERSKSNGYSGSNNKQQFGGNISPVSHRSLVHTLNEQQFSFGSYVPSHLSGIGSQMGQASMISKQMLQNEIGQIRLSMLNVAFNQMQSPNQSHLIINNHNPVQNNMISNAINSHRPKHEQESIDREIRKNSKILTNKMLTSPKSFGNAQAQTILPIQRPQNLKVFMLTDIVTQPLSQPFNFHIGINKDDQSKNLDLYKQDTQNLQLSKNSMFTVQTAANTQNSQSNVKVEIDKLFPVDFIERFYVPIIQEKFFENNTYH